MDSDWTVACAADDPEVVIPWSGKDSSLRFVDLRHSPEALLEIPEAADYPCIAAALDRWNQPDTKLFTAKCDVWSYPAKLFDAEDLAEFAFARGSYIDLLSSNTAMFSSFERGERQLRAWTEMSRSIDAPAARTEWTLRPARIFLPSAEHVPAPSSFAEWLRNHALHLGLRRLPRVSRPRLGCGLARPDRAGFDFQPIIKINQFMRFTVFSLVEVSRQSVHSVMYHILLGEKNHEL